MATAETKPEMCLVCLEAPAVRKLDTCHHFYCENCQLKPNFACPQCRMASMKSPWANLIASQNMKGKMPRDDRYGLPQSSTRKLQKPAASNETCKLCHCRGVTTQAAMRCKECKYITLCKNCSEAHQKSIATKHHVLTPLQRGEVSVLCEEHGELAELFCKPCSKYCCYLCVSLNHPDHDVGTINNAVFVEFDEVRSGMEYQKEWLEMLKSDEKDLQESKATAQKLENVLIKSIEDHAEKCIGEILKNKEALQKQVRADFEVVRVMGKRLKVMPELQRASRDVVVEANSLLNEQAELHSTYIEKLVVLKQQLEKLKEGHPAYKEDRAKYHQAFLELRKKAITFYPRTPNCDIGGFEYRGARCNNGGPCVCDTCKRVFKWPDADRVDECRQKGECTCGTCADVFKFPGPDRVSECRRKEKCICGTCRCFFWRNRLSEKGYCAGSFQCNKQTSCGRCGTLNACKSVRQHCASRISSNFIP